MQQRERRSAGLIPLIGYAALHTGGVSAKDRRHLAREKIRKTDDTFPWREPPFATIADVRDGMEALAAGGCTEMHTLIVVRP